MATYGTRLLSRDEWGARPRRSVSRNVQPEGITVHYGGPSPWKGGSYDHARCASILRSYQAFHMDSRGWPDFSYNSAVCLHGVRYEGRGVGIRSGANGTAAGNTRSYTVVGLWGNDDLLTTEAKRAFYDEAERFKVPLRWGHQDWKPTACPGGPTWAWRRQGFPRPVGGTAPAMPLPVLPPRIGGNVMVSLPLLRQGHRGGAVRSLQILLNTKSGKRLVVDGVFGPRTKTAVLELQRFFRLPADGIVGARTWPTLFL